MQTQNMGRIPNKIEIEQIEPSKKLGTVLAELEIAKSKNDLKQIVSILHFNKSILTKRLGKVESVISFRKLKEYIDEQFISNKMNREEELYDSNLTKTKQATFLDMWMELVENHIYNYHTLAVKVTFYIYQMMVQ